MESAVKITDTDLIDVRYIDDDIDKAIDLVNESRRQGRYIYKDFKKELNESMLNIQNEIEGDRLDRFVDLYDAVNDLPVRERN